MRCDAYPGSFGVRRRFLFGLLVLCWLAATAACQRGSRPTLSPVSLAAHTWPDADVLFRQDPRWLGADDAHSVELAPGRILWLFGDTFVDVRGGGGRSAADLIRNSIGIQTGVDPARAAMRFFWRQSDDGGAAAFFTSSGDAWLWPGDGIRIGNRLLIFFLRMQTSGNALGFSASGWEARVVENPDAAPDRWRTVPARHPRHPSVITLGSGGVLRHGGYLYAYGAGPSGRRAYLARWPLTLAAGGDLRSPQWWAGERAGWVLEAEPGGRPAPLFTDAQTEFGVVYETTIRQFIQIQSIGFGAADVGFRIAANPEGPWGPPTVFFEPAEKRIPGVLIYAAKPHRFSGQRRLGVTYVANHQDPERLLLEEDLYYPRMLKVFLNGGHPPR